MWKQAHLIVGLVGWVATTALGGNGACEEADLDGSGSVGSADLNLVLGEFGCQEGCSADITGDGYTDSLDLNALLSVFGAECGPGSCCEVNGTPGCDDAFCEDFVCSINPTCCESEWDLHCVMSADFWCGLCTNFGPCCLDDGSCTMIFVSECELMGGTSMEAESCELIFCGELPEPCGQAGLGQCWPGGNGTPGCEQEACCGDVCTMDPFCCEVEWDTLCADLGCDINCYACGCCAP